MSDSNSLRYLNGSHCPAPEDLERAVAAGFSEPEGFPLSHLDVCGYCLEQADLLNRKLMRQLAPDRIKRMWSVAEILAMLTIALSALNGLISFSRASQSQVSRLDTFRVFQSNLIEWGFGLVLLPVVLFGAFLTLRWKRARLPMVLCLVASLAVTGGLYLWAGFAQSREQQKLDTLFMQHRWVVFDSPSFDPGNPDEQKREPTPDQLRRELKALREHGNFDGLITFSFYAPKDGDYRNSLPWLAQEAGFKAMIAGIYVDSDAELAESSSSERAIQTRRAIEFERATEETGNIVIAYCLGHNIPPSIPLDSVAGWMKDLRGSVYGKPVSSTFPVVAYLGERGRQIREMGDYWIPDVHAHWHIEASPEKALEETRQSLDRLTVLPADRPVLLKMIMFPTEGAKGATEQSQKLYYEGVVRDLYLPKGMYVSVFGYDTPFKGREKFKEQFAPSEAFTGLLTADGRPKPALDVVRQNWPVQNRP